MRHSFAGTAVNKNAANCRVVARQVDRLADKQIKIVARQNNAMRQNGSAKYNKSKSIQNYNTIQNCCHWRQNRKFILCCDYLKNALAFVTRTMPHALLLYIQSKRFLFFFVNFFFFVLLQLILPPSPPCPRHRCVAMHLSALG